MHDSHPSQLSDLSLSLECLFFGGPDLPHCLVSSVPPQDKGVEARAHRVTEPSEEVRVLLCVLVHRLIEVRESDLISLSLAHVPLLPLASPPWSCAMESDVHKASRWKNRIVQMFKYTLC